MADPILVNQIIASLGLTGKDAEQKRAELEKLSDSELNRLLSNTPSYKKGEIKGFSFLEGARAYKGQIFTSDIQKQGFLGVDFNENSNIQPPPPPRYLLSCG